MTTVITSDAALRAIFSERTTEVFITLVKIESEEIGFTTIRWAKDHPTQITSNGETYEGCCFEVSMISDQDENLPESSLRIQNVDRVIVNTVRTLTRPPNISVSVILASEPDTILRGPFTMKLRNVSWNALVVMGSLKIEDILNEPIPGESMTPELCPGIF
jgi:hypothetical protein